MTNFAGRTGNEAAAWLRGQREADKRYYRECLILQRSARDIPPLAPSAFAAAIMLPREERIGRVAALRRGMIGFSKGADPAGHVFFILGRKKGYAEGDPDGVLTESNDVVSGRTGAIGVVPLSFYHRFWGHEFLYGGTWLNYYDFADFNVKPKPVHESLGVNYEHAIEDIKKALRAHRHDSRLEAALQRDLNRMERKYKKFQH